MEAAVEGGQGRWSTAFALTIAVLLLSVFDALALVLLPLAVLVIALPTENRLRWTLVGLVIWALALLFGGGPLAVLSRGWSLMLGAGFLAVSLLRPTWPVTMRALATVAAASIAGAVGLVATGEAGALDGMIREHFRSVSALTLGDLQTRVPDAPWLAELRLATERIAEVQADIFPALLGLQSVAALALSAWWVRRLKRSESEAFVLGPLRDFRFSDQLIWALIAGLGLVLLPTGTVGHRAGVNALVFMGALYALRGLAVFVFLAKGTRSIPTMVFGAMALIFLYPVALTAALLMGVGDTWLDVRSRVARVG